MIKSTSRQNYLYLVARLYELAAEFTDSDLRAILDNFVTKGEPGIAKAIEALMSLHGVATATSHPVTQASAAKKKANQTWTTASSRDPLSGQALEDLLGDETAFPKVHDVARLMSGELPPLPKEGRSRYIRRVIRHVTTLDEQRLDEFRRNLALELGKKPSSFLSQWKNLIREL